MQKSDKKQTAKSAHRQMQHSTTLNRKYVKKPTRRKNTDMIVPVRHSTKVQHFSSSMPEVQAQGQETIVPARQHPLQTMANEQVNALRVVKSDHAESRKVTAKEMKDQAIKKALAAAASNTAKQDKKAKAKKLKKSGKVHFGFGRVVLAITCAAAAVFAIVYFVNLNMPDISMRVAAMQTGIEASYPNYIPRDFGLSDITSENGKITLNFKNSSTGDAFALIEEQSSWDSNALLTNYVKETYGENYSIIREQGLTIYISGSDAAWVNGGVVYKLKTTSGSLTKKQIKSIAVSL